MATNGQISIQASGEDGLRTVRRALHDALDIQALWRSAAALVVRTLPCHSCSLFYDIEGMAPYQGQHVLADTSGENDEPVTSLDVAAPYLSSHPLVRMYTFAQIAACDACAHERLQAQNPSPLWREFVHLAFWDGARLEAVMSIRMRTGEESLDDRGRGFLMDLYRAMDMGLQRLRRFEADLVRSGALGVLLGQIPMAAAIIDPHGKPRVMSVEAVRLFGAWGGCDGNRLPQVIDAALQPLMPSLRHGRLPVQTPVVVDPLVPERWMRLQISAPLSSPLGRVHYLLTILPHVWQTSLMDRLSPREKRVVELILDGLRTEDIAGKLSRSPKTIESQIGSVYRKLNVKNRMQLMHRLTQTSPAFVQSVADRKAGAAQFR
ncbi:MAG: helix-turn-helix transcriptional regulator [Pseudoxanthomonas sp.]